MANRTLAEHEEEPNVNGWQSTLRIERSAAGAPGLLFVISQEHNGELIAQPCVIIPDGAAFLAPVMAWLSGSPHTERHEAYSRLRSHFAAHLSVAAADDNESQARGAMALMEDVNLLNHGRKFA